MLEIGSKLKLASSKLKLGARVSADNQVMKCESSRRFASTTTRIFRVFIHSKLQPT